MTETLKDFTSLHWWITVAVAGIVLNVFSSYLREWMDRGFSKSSRHLREWAGKKIAEFGQDVESSAGNLPLMTFLAARQTGFHISALHYYVLSWLFNYSSRQVITLPWVALILSIASFILMILGASDFGRAGRCRMILDVIQKMEKKPNK